MPPEGGGRSHGALAALALALIAFSRAAEASRFGSLTVAGRQLSVGNEGRLQSDSEQAARLQGLAEVEQDLESTEQAEDGDLKQLEKQIDGMLQKRDALRLSEARRQREIAFLHAEVARLQGRLQASAGSSSSTGAQQGIASMEAALSNQTLRQASSLSNAAAVSSAATASASAALAGSSALGASGASAGAAAAAASAASAEQTAAMEAAYRRQQYREQQRLQQEQAQRAQEAAAAAAKAERQRLEAKEEERRRAAEEAKRKREAFADSADDSFKQFMKEEDGEDQMGDADYEDSANALAGAIGWNRKEIESKADNAVKQLTEAIGGKKVVRSLQGMMAGIR